jgi:hypothetical protein
MALFRAGALVGQLSGRVAGVVFSHNRGGAYVRNGPSPINPDTEYQRTVRNALATASTRWNDPAFTYRGAWKSWAQNNPIRNRIGESIRLQGNAAFVECNARLVQTGTAVVDTPPVVSAPGGLLTITPTLSIAVSTFQLAFTATPPAAGMRVWVAGCLITSPGVEFVKNKLRHFITGVAAAASPLDMKTAFFARFGTPVVGQSVWLRATILDSTNGLMSTALEAHGLVIA